jgi:hypothetical protein
MPFDDLEHNEEERRYTLPDRGLTWGDLAKGIAIFLAVLIVSLVFHLVR